jgi:hypothetical protein
MIGVFFAVVWSGTADAAMTGRPDSPPIETGAW